MGEVDFYNNIKYIYNVYITDFLSLRIKIFSDFKNPSLKKIDIRYFQKIYGMETPSKKGIWMDLNDFKTKVYPQIKAICEDQVTYQEYLDDGVVHKRKDTSDVHVDV